MRKKQVGFNDSLVVFIYVVLLSTALLFMMEAIMLMVRGNYVLQL